MWTVETNATRDQAVSITGIATWSQSGRLGLEFATPDHGAATDAAMSLLAAGREVYFTPGAQERNDSLTGLAAYRTARAGLLEHVHAALASGTSKAEILRASGLSRAGLDRAIERWHLDELAALPD